MLPKNPLIPMAAITGNLTTEEIRVMLRRYADRGIRQYLAYPRDGCDVPYMSERWLEIIGDIVRCAAELDIDVWLYDEFNWPSGTCRGAVMAENPAYYSHRAVVREDGSVEIVRTETYADILNPDAVDCFLRLTHEVYYQRLRPYFGTVIKGIFTDEPSFSYYANGRDYPYTAGIEDEYRAETGRDLFTDMAHPEGNFPDAYYDLLGRRFRTVFADRIRAWCSDHGILMTGHLLSEGYLSASCRASGNGIRVLRGFSLPGIDEINTVTDLRRAEWLTFGTVQAAIRENGNGGLVETFALGPTDLPPARLEQMLWLEAMFSVDHYVLAVAAADARGNVKKNGWFHPTNYMCPWFEGYPELGASAAEAAGYARKAIAADVCVRVPYAAARRACRKDPGTPDLVSPYLGDLLRALTQAQYQWILLDEDEEAPAGVPVLTADDAGIRPAQAAADALLASRPRKRRILAPDGTLPDNLFFREFTDGSAVILDLNDSSESRSLLYCADGMPAVPFILPGRGHLTVLPDAPFPVPPVYETLSSPAPCLRLYTDRKNTLRCNIRTDKTEFSFRAETALDGITVLIRNYMYDGEVCLDGVPLRAETAAQALTPGLSELYRETAPFSLLPGMHTVSVSVPAQSEPFLPSCFLAGAFASRTEDGTDVLFALPRTVPLGRLDSGACTVLPQFAGRITLEAAVTIPAEAEAVILGTCGLFTRVYLDGVCLGGQLRDFLYPIPPVFRGRNAVLRCEEFTSAAPLFGRRDDVIAEGDGETWTPLRSWFPCRYEACGLESVRFVRKAPGSPQPDTSENR